MGAPSIVVTLSVVFCWQRQGLFYPNREAQLHVSTGRAKSLSANLHIFPQE